MNALPPAGQQTACGKAGFGKTRRAGFQRRFFSHFLGKENLFPLGWGKLFLKTS